MTLKPSRKPLGKRIPTPAQIAATQRNYAIFQLRSMVGRQRFFIDAKCPPGLVKQLDEVLQELLNELTTRPKDDSK